ncbi:MAG TPA: glycosyltransferase [Nitrososphaeraceae archaeon]|nr:glycosyltransferase [Nitrososphaeraceae archaeon]
MKRFAKIIHEDLNAGGGSERFTFTLIEALQEMGFIIDLETITYPNWECIRKSFGNSYSRLIRNINIIDLKDILGSSIKWNPKFPLQKSNYESSENEYDLIINAHGDIFPYFRYGSENVDNRSKTKMITYCHYPLVPQLVKNNSYSNYLKKILKHYFPEVKKEYTNLPFEKIISCALINFDQMMKNTLVLTNSYFSKNAIETIYGDRVLSVLYPPVDVQYFRENSSYFKDRDNRIIVIARYSPDKQIETVLKIAKILKDMKVDFEVVIVGNLSEDNHDYYQSLVKAKYVMGLDKKVILFKNMHLTDLVSIMNTCKFLLHPTKLEPFGISIVEGMSSGLIPIVPFIGGYTEFVPSHLRYRNETEAASIIAKNMNIPHKERVDVSRSVEKFSKKNFKRNVRNIIERILGEEIYIYPTPLLDTKNRKL